MSSCQFALDSKNRWVGCHPGRFALKRLNPDEESFLGLDPSDQTLLDVSLIAEAHHFLTHEAALRAASEINRMGRGPVDVVRVPEA